MSASLRPRGPLPARVYWTRRSIVLLVPLLLVVGLARLLGGGSDGSDGSAGGATAAQAGATSSAAGSETSEPASEPRERRKKKRKATATPTPVLAQPSGPCSPSDITVTPAITTATGGADVPITLNLRTLTSPACTWTVSSETLALKVTSGSDRIWTSQECPAAIPAQDVVVRQAVDTPVVVTWNARRSDEDCSQVTEWALPGYYHAVAAPYGGEPADVQFELVRPTSAVITKTVTPKPQKTKKGRSHEAGDDGEGVSEPNG